MLLVSGEADGGGHAGRPERWEPNILSKSICATKMEVDGHNSHHDRRIQNGVQGGEGRVTGMPEQHATADDSQCVCSRGALGGELHLQAAVRE